MVDAELLYTSKNMPLKKKKKNHAFQVFPCANHENHHMLEISVI
jgi:hypothetical protein